MYEHVFPYKLLYKKKCRTRKSKKKVLRYLTEILGNLCLIQFDQHSNEIVW